MTKTRFFEDGAGGGRLADLLADRLSEKIRRLPVGEKLPSEQKIGEEHRVSRTVVREAISQLKSIGLLTTRQGSGIYVSSSPKVKLSFQELDHHNPLEILKFSEIRSGLDAAAARFAALRRTRQQLSKMSELCRRSMSDSDIIAAAENDTAFHLAIVEATGNDHFITVQKFLSAHLQEGVLFIRRAESYSPEMEKEVHVEHRHIFQAIKAKDAEKAARAAEEHVLNGQKRLKYSLSHLAIRINQT